MHACLQFKRPLDLQTLLPLKHICMHCRESHNSMVILHKGSLTC